MRHPRPIECNRCKKQRWEPQVPEARQGWRRWGNGTWSCPGCQALMIKEAEDGFLAEVAKMCEADVDALIQDLNREPEDGAYHKRLIAACFARLEQLSGH